VYLSLWSELNRQAGVMRQLHMAVSALTATVQRQAREIETLRNTLRNMKKGGK